MSTVAGDAVTIVPVPDVLDPSDMSYRVSCARCGGEWLFTGSRYAAGAAEEHLQAACQPVAQHETWCTDHVHPIAGESDGFCVRRWQTSSGATVELSPLGVGERLTIEVPDNPSMDAEEARALAALLIEAAELVDRSA